MNQLKPYVVPKTLMIEAVIDVMICISKPDTDPQNGGVEGIDYEIW